MVHIELSTTFSRNEYRTDYAKLCDAFAHAIDQLKTGGTTLNLLILSEYPNHKTTTSNFISHLSGKQRIRFQEKWDEYKNIYQQLNNMGPVWFAATTAIIPTPNRPTTPQNLDRYEKERTQYILKLFHELLEIAKIKKWL